MRTTLRSSIALLVSVAVLVIAAVSSAGADPQPSPVPVARALEDGSGGALGMCARDVPDCNDMVLGGGGQSEPGSAGGEEPVAVPPEPVDPTCGEVVEGTGPDGTVSYTPCPGDDPIVEPAPTVIEPTPGMADLHALPFTSVKVDTDGRTVTIDFSIGVAPCYVLDHVDVAYGADTVTITLYEGHDPAATGQVACIDIAMLARTVVTLDEPLGDRVIVDGAA